MARCGTLHVAWYPEEQPDYFFNSTVLKDSPYETMYLDKNMRGRGPGACLLDQLYEVTSNGRNITDPQWREPFSLFEVPYEDRLTHSAWVSAMQNDPGLKPDVEAAASIAQNERIQRSGSITTINYYRKGANGVDSKNIAYLSKNVEPKGVGATTVSLAHDRATIGHDHIIKKHFGERVPECLPLKVGAPVMLTIKLGDRLPPARATIKEIIVNKGVRR